MLPEETSIYSAKIFSNKNSFKRYFQKERQNMTNIHSHRAYVQFIEYNKKNYPILNQIYDIILCKVPAYIGLKGKWGCRTKM